MPLAASVSQKLKSGCERDASEPSWLVLPLERRFLMPVDAVVSDHRDILGKIDEDPDSRLACFSDDLVGVFPRLALAAGNFEFGGVLGCRGSPRGGVINTVSS